MSSGDPEKASSIARTSSTPWIKLLAKYTYEQVANAFPWLPKIFDTAETLQESAQDYSQHLTSLSNSDT